MSTKVLQRDQALFHGHPNWGPEACLYTLANAGGDPSDSTNCSDSGGSSDDTLTWPDFTHEFKNETDLGHLALSNLNSDKITFSSNQDSHPPNADDDSLQQAPVMKQARAFSGPGADEAWPKQAAVANSNSEDPFALLDEAIAREHQERMQFHIEYRRAGKNSKPCAAKRQRFHKLVACLTQRVEENSESLDMKLLDA